jgi:arylsulfatase A
MDTYVLTELGGRHSDNAIEFLNTHLSEGESKKQPFFLYYACNSNHSPYTPDTEIGEVSVAGAARNMAGDAMDKRSDYIYENDVVLGRLLNYLKKTDDPRNPGKRLSETTLVIFTSDNGAEKDASTATGPFRSHKGSVYEGGHRVPFIVSWPEGGIGDGNPATGGRTDAGLIGLKDMMATFAELLEVPLPNPRAGEKGAEDSHSVLAAWRGGQLVDHPMILNDHKEVEDHAASAIRMDNPGVGGDKVPGKWKLFFDAALLRKGMVHPLELYDLAKDPQEQNDRIGEESLKPLVKYLSDQALLHRTIGGHRLAPFAPRQRIIFDWATAKQQSQRDGIDQIGLSQLFSSSSGLEVVVTAKPSDGSEVIMTVKGDTGRGKDGAFVTTSEGLGMAGGASDAVDHDQSISVRFDKDVIMESAEIVAGTGLCGGHYQMADHAPLAIYCVDADNDAQDQSGILSDLGVLKAGQVFRLDSTRHLGADEPGQWRLKALTVRVLEK